MIREGNGERACIDEFDVFPSKSQLFDAPARLGLGPPVPVWPDATAKWQWRGR